MLYYLFLYSAILVGMFMTSLFLYALLIKDNSIVDIGWGIGFILIAIFTLMFSTVGIRQLVISGLVTLWGLRLALFIAMRKIGHGEDFRYAAWRKEWGNWFAIRSLLQIFMLQGVLMLIISTPIILTNGSQNGDLVLINILGVALWLIGFFFETIGDYQKFRFKQNPDNKGKVLSSGLWNYTRHPNYFGETAMWWGIWLIAIPVEYWLYGLISPLVLTFLLLFVSGIPMLEKKYAGNPEWEQYKRRTSAFFPLPPKQ